MTKTRIKEKLLELLVIYKINLKKTFTIDFARFICEEMRESIHCCEEDEESAERKTQEILKALE
jgi:hypothetical protein